MTLVDFLTDLLEWRIRKHGEDDFVTRSLREQLRLAKEAPRSAAEQFLIGSVPRNMQARDERQSRKRD